MNWLNNQIFYARPDRRIKSNNQPKEESMKREEAEHLVLNNPEGRHALIKRALEDFKDRALSPYWKAYTATACCIDKGSVDTDKDSYGWFVVFTVESKRSPEYFSELSGIQHGSSGFAFVIMDVRDKALVVAGCRIYKEDKGCWWSCVSQFHKPKPPQEQGSGSEPSDSD